jgi:thioredoxin-like negative regulator of GroEL
MDRLAILAGAVLAGVLFYLLYRFLRTRQGRAVERLDVDVLGLENMDAPCAFVMFTTAACRPCKAALHVVRTASERAGGASVVTTVDAIERSELAVRYSVRTIPTTFLITASGRVVRRWLDVPDPEEVSGALAEIAAA